MSNTEQRAEHDPWAGCRIHVMGPQRKKPKAGDRRTTKKHGEQVRILLKHNGAYVVSRGRNLYEWVSIDDPRAALYRPALTRATTS